MNKKLGVLLLTVAVMISLCAAASASLYYVTGNNVRVRSGPGTDYDIVSHLSMGAKIDVLSTSHGWARMTLWSGSDEAYISTKFISRTKPTSDRKSTTPATKTTTPAMDYKSFVSANYNVIVNPTNNYVNMRWEASKSSPVKNVYYDGAQIRVLAENAYWCQVMDETTSDVGFILKSLLLKVN